MKSQIELHAHLYFRRYNLEDVLKVMEENGLNVVAPLYLNGKAFLDVQKGSSRLFNQGYDVDSDDLAVNIRKDGKEFYLLKGAELHTGDNFHMITLGSDNVEPYKPMREMIEYALKQDSLVIFDHPLVDNNHPARELSKSAKEDVENICKEYTGHIALEWNGYCIPLVRILLGGGNTNKDVLQLSNSLAEKGYNNPVVSDTDIHARNKNSLKAIGTSRVISDIDLSSGKSIISSLKRNIFSGEHQNTFKTVSLSHFIPNWGLPYLFRKVVHRPRG